MSPGPAGSQGRIDRAAGVLGRRLPRDRPVRGRLPRLAAQNRLAGAPSDVLEQVASPGASGLIYDAGTDRYQLSWKTQKGWAGSCRTLVLKLRDGSTHTAQFRFKWAAPRGGPAGTSPVSAGPFRAP